MKKIIIISAVVLVIAAVIGVLVFIVIQGNTVVQNNDRIAILNETNPTEILLYGDDINFDSSLHYKKINSLTSEEIGTKGDYNFKLLIINDRENKLEITKEQLKQIKELADSIPMNFFYFGTKYLEEIKEAGMAGSISVSGDSAEMGSAYCQSRMPGLMEAYSGFWTEVEESYSKMNSGLQEQIILSTMVRIIKEVN